MTPIILPHPNDPSWKRAETIVKAFRNRGERNPLIVAGIVDGYAESAWTAFIAGDHDQSFGPWQLKWQFYGPDILDHLSIDIRTETDLAKHVDALLRALSVPANLKTMEALDGATTGAEATRLFAGGFERASAGDAVERRVAIAAPIEVWLAKLPA